MTAFSGRTVPGSPDRTAYYDAEAAVYDETRGGGDRARAAAAAVVCLVTPPGRLLDVAGGTGSVTAELAALGWDVTVTDLSSGMLRVAAGRLPGRALRADATRLPVADSAVDVVTTVWLLHLLPVAAADAIVAEARRVLRPGGHWVTTVDKDLAHGRSRAGASDAADRVAAVAQRAGLRFVGQESFRAAGVWGSAGAGDPVFPVAAYRRV